MTTSIANCSASIFRLSGDVRLEVAAPQSGDWFRIMAPTEQLDVVPGDPYRLEMFAAELAAAWASPSLVSFRRFETALSHVRACA